METTGIIGVILGEYWGYIRIMEKKMETSIMGYIGFRVVEGFGIILGLCIRTWKLL